MSYLRNTAALASLAVIAACSSGENMAVSEAGSTLKIDAAKVPACWAQAGLEGDIYKFLTPEEIAGLSKVGGASKAQVQTFKQCASA